MADIKPLKAGETGPEVFGASDTVPASSLGTHTHAIGDLTQSGATTGQVPKWNGSAWAPADDASGGGGWATVGSTPSFGNTTAETDFINVTVPADTLSEVGSYIDIDGWCTMTNNSGANQTFTFRVYADGTEVYEDASGNIATSASPRAFKVRGKVVRIGASTAAASFELFLGSSAAAATGSGDLGATALRIAPIICGTSFAWDFATDTEFKITLQLGAAASAYTWTGFNYLCTTGGLVGPEGPQGGFDSTQNFNEQSGASYDLVLTDAGSMVIMTANDAVLNVPNNTDVGIPVGKHIDIVQEGTGSLTITPLSGVTIRSRNGLKIQGQYGAATLIKRSANVWLAVGDLKLV